MPASPPHVLCGFVFAIRGTAGRSARFRRLSGDFCYKKFRCDPLTD